MAGGRGKEADFMGVRRGWRFPMTGGEAGLGGFSGKREYPCRVIGSFPWEKSESGNSHDRGRGKRHGDS